MHSSRSAAGGQRVRPLQRRRRAATRRTAPRRASAAAPQSQRGTPCVVGGEARAHLGQRVAAAPQARHDDVSIEPWTSTSSRVPARRCSRSMFCVMTASSSPRALELDQRPCAPLGSLSSQRREAVAVEVPEALGVGAARRRCGRPPSGRRSPTARCPGERKSGIPDGTEIPAPVSATTESAARSEPASAGVRRSLSALPLRRALAQEGARCPPWRPRRRTRPRSPPSRPRCPRRGRPWPRPP